MMSDKEIDEKLDANFDENSLSIYGAMLTEELDSAKPGEEVAKPRAIVGEILSKQEKAKREIQRQKRK